MKRFAACLLLLSACVAHSQGTVYRCGPDGKTYSQQPCKDGKKIDADDSRTEAQRADSLATTAADKMRADALERNRLKREAAQKPAAASGFNARPAAASEAAKVEDKGKRVKKRVKKLAGSKPKKADAETAGKNNTQTRKKKV